ncbi:HesA/MoeB/ThiF family protein [Fertoebacter nigrum]|uniref:Molybdopterin-synthase adenylyltransferase n=1 Tax=Fertoeibacter niger TaxID=2656921 RepID=A0A8X8KRD5_9RHOB|nr:HesA/MoeB/ThiF family protein [Fertoeibacter niger]NUB45097.1 HesA/MoeB/ThiF family protein [Fertoeibacter niger]
MILVLAMMAALWFTGRYLAAPVRLRLGMIGGLWLAVVGLHLALAEGHPLRLATGGSAQVWLALAVAVALVLGYRAALARLRGQVTELAPVSGGAFRPAELDRYARHILLREIGGPGQRKLKDSKVLVIGAGGLGSPALLYLAAAGVGTIGVIDDDSVENSNLQRQIVHTDARIGLPKVASAEVAMRALNPFITVRPYHRRLTGEIAADLFADYDLILDGTDSFDTRYMVNRVAAELGKPLIAAAITQWEGQISLYDPARGGPCFECVFPTRPAPGLVPTCAEAGVAAPLPGIIGAMMAMEAVKHITGAGQGLRGRLMIFDALYGESRVIGVKRREGCAVCGARA